MGCYALDFREIDQAQVALVGGKGARLGELARIEGVRIPAGFCVTTDAFGRIMAEAPSVADRLEPLSRLEPDDREAIRVLTAEIRRTLEETPVPGDVATAIKASVAGLGERGAYAVRSSATAEDLPVASFAGQQDTYLNVLGPEAVLEHVIRCWASLFTDRAVIYRLRHGLGHRRLSMAVVVQRMLFPRAAGVLFTADPVTSNRKVAAVESVYGLGEELLSGLVSADVHKVRDGVVVARTVAVKQRAVCALPGGGTREQAVEPERQARPALSDAEAVRLADLGRRIEAHFGHPQDVEWCLDDDGFAIVQSRPITTLFPVPVAGDQENHVYVSVGHGQMMTDAMTPLGISFWQMTTARPMHEAGGRLFVDVTRELGSPARREDLLRVMGRSDPLIGDALQSILERGDFIPSFPEEGPPARGRIPGAGPPAAIETDPAIVAGLIARSEASIAACRRDIRTKAGSALLDFILTDLQALRRILFDPQSHQAIMAGMEAAWWLNEQLEALLGETDAVDVLTQAAPHNVTSEMGLALLDVADVIRPHPEVVAFLESVEDESFLDSLPTFPDGREARDAIQVYLDTYGMRCAGEIDITRPRWSERPATLIPMLLGNVRNFKPGAAERRLQQGRRQARAKERELLARLRDLPDGDGKAAETKRMIDRLRTFAGYREYPKYGIVSRYFVYKQALLEEAGRLTDSGVLREAEDIFFLRFVELQAVLRTGEADAQLIRERRAAHTSYRALTPPRVLTSDGEVITGSYRRDDLPADAPVGLAVCAGTVEGRARVILDIGQAELEAGDILVTACTDPSSTPLFVVASGLVTEVGGLMTHGAVIAREYGLPAVVGVERATQLIRNGQRIRVHGSAGYVELLP